MSSSNAFAEKAPCPGSCDDHNPDTLDWCHNGGCVHDRLTKFCPVQGKSCSSSLNGQLNQQTSSCALEGVSGDVGVCVQGQCYSAEQAKREGCDLCQEDSQCNDKDTYTVNWCNAGQCAKVELEDWNCYDPQRPRTCYMDAECDDQNPDTINWCNSYGECNSTSRSNKTGKCEAPPLSCSSNWDCLDGDLATKNWCHEGTCRSVVKDGKLCRDLGTTCWRNRDCRNNASATPDLFVTWCQQGQCKGALRNRTSDVCISDDQNLGNIKPEY